MKPGAIVKCASIVYVLVLTGCYYDNEEKLYPASFNCSPADNPAFSTHVSPLLQRKCNSCHSGSFPSGGIRLDTFAEVMKYVNNGSLMGSINHTSGFVAMPKDAGKMPPCEIDNIQNWINAGSLNN
ncbi:MAG: hypothetical protein WA874_11355 [Chryseosolibacter sp.]